MRATNIRFNCQQLTGSPKEENLLHTPLDGSKLIRPVPIPIPIPPSRKMADLNLNQKTQPTTEMFPLSASSNEQKARGSRASGFKAMSSNGDSIMGVA